MRMCAAVQSSGDSTMMLQHTPLTIERPDCAQVQYPHFNSTPSGDRNTGARVPQLQNFIIYCSQKTGQRFSNYAEVEIFSIVQFRTFWLLFLNWSKIPFSGSADVVCE